jgi:osmotically-inducible protein OsmY
MKKIFVLMALSSFSLLSADRFICRGCCDNYGFDGWGYGGYSQDCCYDQFDGNYGGGFVGYQSNDPMPMPMTSYGPMNDQSGQMMNFQDGQTMNFQGPADGFQRVKERLQVSDPELAKKVHDALNSGNNYQDLAFRVERGIVTLRGAVENPEYKAKAEEAVRKIDGVRNVNSFIVIVGPRRAGDASKAKADSKYPNDFAATDADRQLNAKIRDKLSGGWFSKGYDAVILRTNNGVVIITGQVDSQEEANKLNDQLRGIEGLRKANVQVAVKRK